MRLGTCRSVTVASVSSTFCSCWSGAAVGAGFAPMSLSRISSHDRLGRTVSPGGLIIHRAHLAEYAVSAVAELCRGRDLGCRPSASLESSQLLDRHRRP